MLATSDLIGRSLVHYRVLEKLGEGGMGEVYLAEDGRLGRRVALKVLPSAMACEPRQVERFRREARSVAALNHPNIVSIYSVEQDEDRGVPFLVMELVEGETLARVIPGRGLSLETFIEIAVPLADALEAAHACGVIHRDLKPQNVMVSRQGRVKVLDFGIARMSRGDEESEATANDLTLTGRAPGTTAYMSPEQALGRPVDHRTDIFSLGIVLYEMITGRRPFRGRSRNNVMAAILYDTPLPVGALRSDLPARLDEILSRCLEKDPVRRYPDAGELRSDLLGLTGNRAERTLSTTIFASPALPPTSSASTPAGSSGRHSAFRLPGPPRCFGRESEVRALIETLCGDSPWPVPVLGPAGAGKTTITLAALHNPRVVERFGKRRYFVRCDGATSCSALLGEIARCVSPEIGPPLEPALFDELERGPAVLVLDNLETPWERDTSAVEELLCHLAALPCLALAVSLRGEQRPYGPSWREAIHVGPLAPDAARSAFLAVAGERYSADPDLEQLLTAVDRLPLAVALLASQAEGEPDLSGLWQRWQEQRTALLQRAGGRQRLHNMEVSLKLSVGSPRISRGGFRLLSILGLLPDGAAHSHLDALLPGEGKAAAAVLRKVGLAFDQGRRLRTLAPIREFLRQYHTPRSEDLDRTVDHYLELALLGERIGGEGGAEIVRQLAPETGNLGPMVLLGLDRADPAPAISAALGMAELIRFTGLGNPVILERARGSAQALGRLGLEADCIRMLGEIALYRSDHAAARAHFEEALPLYRKAENAQAQGHCFASLGESHLSCSEIEAACRHFEEARSLFLGIGNLFGQARCMLGFGSAAVHRSDSQNGHELLLEALSLFRRAGNTRWEANCLQKLGNAAIDLDDFDSARVHFEEALELFRRVGSVQGEANSIRGLGDVALFHQNPQTARIRFEEALSLYRRVGSPLGLANCCRRLGDTALALFESETARARFEEALPLFRRFGDILGEATCMEGLGTTALALSEQAAARAKLQEALELYQRAQQTSSIGRVHGLLARVAQPGSEERRTHIEAARQVWVGIDRPDLFEALLRELEEHWT